MSISRDEWLAALSEAGLMQKSDPDALTVAEFGAMTGFARTAAMSRLRTLVATGKAVEVSKWTVTNGRRVQAKAYRLKS